MGSDGGNGRRSRWESWNRVRARSRRRGWQRRPRAEPPLAGWEDEEPARLFLTCVLLDSGEGGMEGLGHGRALSCGQTEGLSGAAEAFHPPPPTLSSGRGARSAAPASPLLKHFACMIPVLQVAKLRPREVKSLARAIQIGNGRSLTGIPVSWTLERSQHHPHLCLPIWPSSLSPFILQSLQDCRVLLQTLTHSRAFTSRSGRGEVVQAPRAGESGGKISRKILPEWREVARGWTGVGA